MAVINEAALRAFLEKHKNINRSKDQSDGTLWYELPKDTTRVLIQYLPPVHGNLLPGKYLYQHWINTSQVKVVYCFKTYELDCPLCNLLQNYEGRLSLEEWSYKLQSKVNVLILQDPSYQTRYKRTLDSKAPHVLSTNGNFTLEWLIKGMLEKDPETGGDFTDPDKSYAWLHEREKTGGKFIRKLSPALRRVGADETEKLAILNKAADFNKVYKTPDDAYVQKMRDAVLVLKDVIENKIISMGSSGGSYLENSQNPAAMEYQVPPQAESYSSPSPYPMRQEAYAPTPSQAESVKPFPVEDLPVQMSMAPQPSLPPAQPVNAAPPSVSNRPQGSPDCFGVKAIHDPTTEKCKLCLWDLHCQNSIRNAG